VAGLDPMSAIPLYHQLKELLRREILAGRWSGESFPTELELCRQFCLSRSTVRQALEPLVQEGLLRRKPGKGTVAAQPKIERNLSRYHSFTQDMEAQGRSVTVRVLEVETVPAQPGLARALALDPEAPVLHVTRVRLVDQEPLVLETRLLPLQRFPGIADVHLAQPRFLQTALDHCGVRVATEERYFEPGLAGPFEARVLGVRPGSPVLVMERLYRDGSGTPVTMSRWTVRGDRCRYLLSIESPSL
jgi:GntR family transcriptional regulator